MGNWLIVCPEPTVKAYRNSANRLRSRLHGFNIWPTFVQQKLNGYWGNVERSVQHHSTFSRIKEMLYGCWMKVKTNLILIQHAFNNLSTVFTLSAILNDLFKRPRHFVQQSVESMLKQMLKPFKRAFIVLVYIIQWSIYSIKKSGKRGLFLAIWLLHAFGIFSCMRSQDSPTKIYMTPSFGLSNRSNPRSLLRLPLKSNIFLCLLSRAVSHFLTRTNAQLEVHGFTLALQHTLYN